MISKRPIFYTIIPSIVIIIGYIWYRRKRNGRVDCDTGGSSSSATEKNNTCKLLDEKKLVDNQELISSSSAYSNNKINSHLQHSESLPIGTLQQQQKQNSKEASLSPVEEATLTQDQQRSQSPTGSTGSSTSSLCKSAPIDIAPNPRSPPKRITEQEIDCEILKLKPQESDIKNLRYIEEPSVESDLEETPVSVDSPPYRFPMNRTQPIIVEPVVIKATMEAKVSPENSFRERKYTQTESDDSNRLIETEKSCSSSSSSSVKVHQQQKQQINENDSSLMNDDVTSNNNNSNDNGCIMQDDDEISEATTQMPTNNCNSNKSSTPTRTQQPVQIASPSLSICSMHSGDSGQGSSPPQSVGAPTITYDFLVQGYLVGYIIGNGGRTIKRVKEKTGANVVVRKGGYGAKRQKVCTLEGTQAEIDAALKMIRSYMPERLVKDLNTERIFITRDNKVVPTFNIASLQLHLIEEINNDVTIISIADGHLFLQQPLHPSYPGLAHLQHRMNQWYSRTNAPELPDIIDNAICAYLIQDNWYRVQIMSHDSETRICVIKYLDFGGYTNVHATELRQIHADFMTLPFQAIECVLSNVRPPNGQAEWSKESIDTINSFTSNVIVQAQVAGYTQDDIPEVFLFVSITKDNVLFINQELCARQLAEWVPNQDEQQQV